MDTCADYVAKYRNSFPAIVDIAAQREVFWVNQKIQSFKNAATSLELTAKDEELAAQRLDRFRPYIATVFPQTAAQGGMIESELVDATATQKALADHFKVELPGRLMLKLDSHLPISGSIKARGGIYEVLKYAETLALDAGLLTLDDDYALLNTEKFKRFFADYSLAVGSTGNLGLSIGIMGAQLGFKVTVHMSADAKQWKKDLLRSKGVNVLEYAQDYGYAVEQGRQEAQKDPRCHFVDDETSTDLFLGYSVAARRLQHQLAQQQVRVDADHPLFVYLPCGVGGGPGGVAFGLKLCFGDHVHCLFVEPTKAPAVLLGMGSGLHENISAQDLDINGMTAADGLAVARPSGLACRMMDPLLDGVFSIADEQLYQQLSIVADTQHLQLEPSALAGFSGIAKVLANTDYLKSKGLNDKMTKATHIAWSTGGSMVPDTQWQAYYQQGQSLLNSLDSDK